MKKIIGVYGPSGTGKTTFCKRLSELSCIVIDADAVAREVMEKGSPLLKKLSGAFGEDILLPDGSLNRKKLGEIVFTDKNMLKRLNRISWPEINRIIKEKALGIDEGIVVIDCAMLNRVSVKEICDELVFIQTSEKVLADRISKREGIEEALAESRVKLQLRDFPSVHKRIIENDSGIDDLIKKAEDFYKELKGC